jgi:hypothetical protein
LVIENLSFIIGAHRSGSFAKNAQFSGIALQRGKPQPKAESELRISHWSLGKTIRKILPKMRNFRI